MTITSFLCWSGYYLPALVVRYKSGRQGASAYSPGSYAGFTMPGLWAGSAGNMFLIPLCSTTHVALPNSTSSGFWYSITSPFQNCLPARGTGRQPHILNASQLSGRARRFRLLVWIIGRVNDRLYEQRRFLLS